MEAIIFLFEDGRGVVNCWAVVPTRVSPVFYMIILSHTRLPLIKRKKGGWRGDQQLGLHPALTEYPR